jgi:N-methylhydantoinase A
VLTSEPLDEAVIARAVDSMERQARADIAAAARPGEPTLRRSIDLRYRRQTHDVEVDLGDVIDERSLADVVERFEQRYEEIHGTGTGYRQAGIEATTVRVTATVPAFADSDAPQDSPAAPTAAPEPARHRDVYFDGWCRDVPIYDAQELAASVAVTGPALLEWPTTTLVIHPGQRAEILGGGDARVTFADAA